MNNFFKKGISFALTLALAVTMCFGSIGTAKVYAAEDVALSVYDGEKLVKEYSLDDLKEIAAKEGNVKYKFSGYNRNPSFYTFGDENAYPDVKEVVGPTVEGILDDAGVTYTDDQLISFAAPDGVTESFIAGDFFKERYYFPNGRIEIKGTGYKGTPAQEANYADKEVVVPMIDLHRSDEWESVLRFGQTAPNEQNNAAFVKYVADGGKIIVGDVQTVAWDPINDANYLGGDILPETELEFKLPQSMLNKKVAAYFTTDGTEPGHGDAIYNYDKYGGLQKILLPEEEGTVTYKFKVIGYGKLDSKTTTFTYKVVDADQPAVPENFTATTDENGFAELTWTPVKGADGYEILKNNPDTGEMYVYHQINSGDECGVEDAVVAVGTEYSYQVRAFKKLSSGQKVYSSATEKQTVLIKDMTPPAKPSLNSAAKTGYGGIQIKWSKVEGADGYQVWRYDAVSKKYTLAKTITNGSTVSWKNTGLKTGRKYTYKVRAYRLVDGEKIFSAYSGTRAATPALNKPVITKVVPASKAITVKWKQVPGANGYKIYRSTTGKAGSYKVVKTITKGGTVSWKNTKLKKGKKYYYKVKAYRIVDKKYVYSSISLSKYTKSK